MRKVTFSIAVLLLHSIAAADLPAPPNSWSDWPMKITADQPGELSADALLDKPAGRNGPIVIRGGHFFSGDRRVRFWGVNLAFGANFPTHDQADQLAIRFARFGINAVRFHHMDSQVYPSGIFADASFTALSPEALDRLDYFIAALKKQGVYADINLHVSRSYDRYHAAGDSKKSAPLDKMVDLFDPDLIAAQRQYAGDLLGHVNAYTHARYGDEPAVAIVEINNENSLFMWGADQSLAKLPAFYRDELAQQWNRWLAARYPTRDKLSAAWERGEEKFGDSLLPDGDFESFNPGHKKTWIVEQHDSAKMKVTYDSDGQGDGKPRGAIVDVTAVDGTAWHLQLTQPGLMLKKGKNYLLYFEASSDRPMKLEVAVSQAHDPWNSLGLATGVDLTPQRRFVNLPFTASLDENRARLSFSLGSDVGRVYLPSAQLVEGGRTGLTADEDPARGSVLTPGTIPPSQGRRDDWYTFLQQTEETYYVGMMNFLKTDLGVKCPITGTIGFGPLGTLTQSKMDFVDAHAYWQHPSFPHRPWDGSDWTMGNTPMVDQPEKATLWNLAATRVAGKPFTVTEYQHPAPSDWQAECVPLIATYAGLQDWDGVFLYAYSHDWKYDKGKISSFFDIEGNAAKMPLMPMGARLFSLVHPGLQQAVIPLTAQQLVTDVPRYSLNPAGFLKDIAGFDAKNFLSTPIAISYSPAPVTKITNGPQASWTAQAPGSGRFIFGSESAAVFVGFSSGQMPVDLSKSQVRIESMETPFAALVIVPSGAGQTFLTADHLLVTAVARAQNSNMQWDAGRHSVSNHWGQPPEQIEVVRGSISLPGRWAHAVALDADGKPTTPERASAAGDRTVIRLGDSPAIAYEITRAAAR